MKGFPTGKEVKGETHEWMRNQGSQNQGDPKLEMCRRLDNAYTEVMKRAVNEGLSIKKAAYTIALERLAANEAKHNNWPSQPRSI